MIMDEKPKNEKPKRSARSGIMRAFIFVGGGILACIVFTVLLVVFVFGVTQPVVDAGSAYFQALQDGRVEEAYALFAPSLQEEISYEEFLATFGNENDVVKSWTINQRSIENGAGSMSGSITVNDRVWDYDLYLDDFDGEWLITGYNFR